MTRAELVEIGAKAAREVWRDLEAVRANTMDWEHIDRHERSACLAAQAAALAAIEAAGMAVVPMGLWQTLHNGLNCVIHEEDNDPPDVANAVRIARATLDEARAMIAVSPVDARDE